MKLTQWFPGDVKPVHVGVYERLTIERDEARRTAREAHEMGTRVVAQRDALLEALKEYGWHHEGCPQYPTYTHPDRWPACTCGFDDAIKAVEGEKT